MSVEYCFRATPEELAAEAATRLAGLLKGRDLGRLWTVALSGGRIAPPLYRALIAEVRGQFIPMDGVHFFWADERAVPPGDAESNYRQAKEHLFDPLDIPAPQVHRICAEVEPEYACAQAESELCRIAPFDAMGQPVLDLVILGMGEDGHVASLFPEEPEGVRADPAVFRAVTATKPPPRRVTVGYGVVAAARAVWILASGKGKLAPFQALISGGSNLPVARVARSRESTVVFQDIDPSAAAGRSN